MTIRITVAVATTVFVLSATVYPLQRLPQGVVLVYAEETAGVVPPVVEHRTNPSFLALAMRERLQDHVSMDVTVGVDGRVRDVMLTQSADEDIDRAAIEAIAQWVFQPGTLNDVVVPVRMSVTMAFGRE